MTYTTITVDVDVDMDDFSDEAIKACALTDLAAQVEALQADADRLHTIFLGLNHDGFAWWLPEWCMRDGEVAPTLDQMRAQIDVERAAIDAARKDQP